jgi:hypothetical protein
MSPAAGVLERRRAPVPVPAPAPSPAPRSVAAAEEPGPAARALARTLPTATAGPAGAGRPVEAAGPVAPGEEVELEGGARLALTPEADEWLAAQKGPAGVRVRLGRLAHGTLTIRKTGGKLQTTGEGYQRLPWPHPALAGLAALGLTPVLAVRFRSGLVQGHLSLLAGEKLLSASELPGRLQKAADALGWAGLDRLQLPIATNTLQGRSLVVRSDAVRFRVGGFLSGQGTFALEGEAVTFAATLTGKVPGVDELKVPISRAVDGSLTGSITVAVTLRNFSGQLTAAFGHGLVDVHGTATYTTERMSGTVTIVATDKETAKALTASQLPDEVMGLAHTLVGPEAAAGVAPAAANGAAAPAPAVATDGVAAAAGPRPGPRVVVGWGTLHVELAEWLSGDALVVMEPDGNVTVVGKVTPKMKRPLVEQQPEKTVPILSLKPRASYGLPVIGNIYIEASIELEAFARFGPVTLDKMELGGNWSTNPERLKSLGLTGTLNASAVAGLRLTAEGKAGLEILDHDIAVGVGLKATAGIKGYVVAVPRIGYRELADPLAGKRGEFFNGGHLEVAAQPFLGLEGYFFVELDSPWWSPAPDKRWPWPIGSLEYALPGAFGIGADIEHVLGSGQVPVVTISQVSFNPENFLTDMVDEKIPNKVARDDKAPGSWKERPQPADALQTAEVPGAGETKGPRPPTKPGTPSRGAAPTPPAVADRRPPPGPRVGQPPTGERPDGKVVPPEVQKRWQAALIDIRALKVRSRKDPLSAEEMAAALADLRANHRFTELTVRRVGDHWHLHAAMNPKLDDSDFQAQDEPLHGAMEPHMAGSEAEAVLRGDAAAKAAGVPAEIYQSGQVFVAADFPDIDTRPVRNRPPGPRALPVGRPTVGVSRSALQELEWRADLFLITKKGWLIDLRVNQQQVAVGGRRATRSRRPDLSLEVRVRGKDRMVYIEYDRAPGTRSRYHAHHLLQGDPTAIVILKIVDFDIAESLSQPELAELREAMGERVQKQLAALLDEP